MRAKPHLTLLGFGVRFEAFFWITMVFVGYRFGEENIGRALLWIGLLTVSILVHELGHALAYRHYGAKAQIAMHGMGGLTYGTDTEHITPKQQIVISLAGAALEMAVLGAPAWALRAILDPTPWSWTGTTLTWLIWINVVWALVNLAPVWPMDGGHVIEQIFIIGSGKNRKRLVHKTSIVAGAVAMALGAFYDMTYVVFLFGFFVIMNLFGLQVFKTKKPIQIWPGLDTANGTASEWEDHLVERPPTRSEHLSQGFTALAAERTHDTDRHLASVESPKASKKEQNLADELRVWRHLTANRPDQAERAFAEMNKPSKTLRAVMGLQTSTAWVDELATAIKTEPKHPASQQGILWAARNGYTEQLVVALLAEGGPEALGHAVRVETELDKAGLEDERCVAERLI